MDVLGRLTSVFGAASATLGQVICQTQQSQTNKQTNKSILCNPGAEVEGFSCKHPGRDPSNPGTLPTIGDIHTLWRGFEIHHNIRHSIGYYWLVLAKIPPDTTP
eukprot:sb/3478150/